MKKVKSTFQHDAEDWTINGDAASYGWKAHGGNPHGYFTWTDAVTSGADAYYSAPVKFLGDRHGFDGGNLSYDIRDIGSDPDGAPDVELISSDGTTLVAVLGEAGESWTHYSIDLSTGVGWHVGSLDGADATTSDFRHVLGHLSQLLIRAEYVDGDEVGGLDNVILAKQALPAHAAENAQTMAMSDSNLQFQAHLFDHGHSSIF